MAEATATRPTSEDEVLYDPLTGLPNRHLQRAHLVHALRRAKRTTSRVALLFLDIDDFHAINERSGSEVGDQVLIEIAARLQACLRDTDLTARLDGDEFVIVCEDLSEPADVEVVTRRITDALAAPLHIGSEVIEVRASIGSAVSGDDDRPGDLLTAADHVMTRIKRARRT